VKTEIAIATIESSALIDFHMRTTSFDEDVFKNMCIEKAGFNLGASMKASSALKGPSNPLFLLLKYKQSLENSISTPWICLI